MKPVIRSIINIYQGINVLINKIQNDAKRHLEVFRRRRRSRYGDVSRKTKARLSPTSSQRREWGGGTSCEEEEGWKANQLTGGAQPPYITRKLCNQ